MDKLEVKNTQWRAKRLLSRGVNSMSERSQHTVARENNPTVINKKSSQRMTDGSLGCSEAEPVGIMNKKRAKLSQSGDRKH